MNTQQADKIRAGQGFIAALDQSGGSTPKALQLYGVDSTAYSNEEDMFDLVHAMRTRIAQAPAFTGERGFGGILFEWTMAVQRGARPTAQFRGEGRGVCRF